MKTNTTYVTKNQLVTDYVTKFEFAEFKEEMYDFKDDMNNFRSETGKRFDSVDKRLTSVERKLDEYREEMRRTSGAMLDQFRHDLKVGFEFMMDVREGKKDRSEPFPF